MENKEIDEKIAFLTKSYNSLEEIYKKNPIPDNVKDWKDKVIPKLYGTNKIKISRMEIIRFPSDSYSFQMEKDIHEYEVARTVIVDTGIKLTLDNNLKESIEIRKLLKAREENIDFELQLAEMITGDNVKFPYRKSSKLTEFFQNLGYGYIHEGETRKYWVKEILEELNIKKIYQLITTGLFHKKYFIEFAKEKDIDMNIFFNAAASEFKQFIENSITANEAFDLSSVLDMNVNIELLFDNKAETNDTELNKLIEDSKDRFVSNDRQVAIEKLWDAFERLKTYFSPEGLKKNLSAAKVVDLISENFDKEFINEEFDKLTTIGNDYRIRHHETNRKELMPVHLNYFYFRMLSLIDLCLVYLKKEETVEDLF
jgi:hypothetical protein